MHFFSTSRLSTSHEIYFYTLNKNIMYKRLTSCFFLYSTFLFMLSCQKPAEEQSVPAAEETKPAETTAAVATSSAKGTPIVETVEEEEPAEGPSAAVQTRETNQTAAATSSERRLMEEIVVEETETVEGPSAAVSTGTEGPTATAVQTLPDNNQQEDNNQTENVQETETAEGSTTAAVPVVQTQQEDDQESAAQSSAAVSVKAQKISELKKKIDANQEKINKKPSKKQRKKLNALIKEDTKELLETHSVTYTS